MSLAGGSLSLFRLKNSLRSRLNLFLTTAFPTFLLAVIPNLRNCEEVSQDVKAESELEKIPEGLERRTVKFSNKAAIRPDKGDQNPFSYEFSLGC